MTDFEGTVKQLLNQNVDAALGPRRPAPRLNVAAPVRPGVRPWLVPLLAAAGAAAAIAAIVVPVRLSADRPAGGPNIGGLTAPQSSSAAPPTATSDLNAPPPSPLSPAATAVDLGGAKLRLPVGWVAREVADPRRYGKSVYSREWCLGPAKSAGPARPDCPLQFGPTASATTSGVPVNANVPLGNRLGGTSCPADALLTATGGGLVSFGQRDGFSSEWHDDCADSTPWTTPWILQYVVDTAPGYVLFSDQMTPELLAAMVEISQHASLPAQTGPLLLYDIGVVRAVTRRANGYLMTITPSIQVGGDWEPNGADRSYLIPHADLRLAAVGTRVGVTTDGTNVIDIGPPIAGHWLITGSG